MNPSRCGTKMAAHYTLEVPAGGEQYIRLRLTDYESNAPFDGFDAVFESRKKEADAFYDALLADKLSPEQVNIARQCYAGRFNSSSYFLFPFERKTFFFFFNRTTVEQTVLSLRDG